MMMHVHVMAKRGHRETTLSHDLPTVKPRVFLSLCRTRLVGFRCAKHLPSARKSPVRQGSAVGRQRPGSCSEQDIPGSRTRRAHQCADEATNGAEMQGLAVSPV